MNERFIRPNAFKKSVFIHSSKSYANRLLILASLEEREISINNLPLSTDVQTMISCLKSIGIQILQENNRIIVKNSFPKCENHLGEDILLLTGDGGSTNRFLLPLLALGKKRYIIIPKGPMQERPMDELFSQLKALGVMIETSRSWFALQGPITYVSNISVDCSQSTQFASALSPPLAKRGISVTVKNLKSSKKYWALTQYLFKVAQKKFVWDIPQDFSSMSYPLALAATDGEVLVKNYFGEDPYQGDSVFIRLLKNMNATIIEGRNFLKVQHSQLRSIYFNCSDCLDIVPSLAYLCSYAKGKSVLTNIANLQYKESHRIQEIGNLLRLFGVTHKIFDNSIEITGPTQKIEREIFVDPPEDHRMIMTSYLFLRHNRGGKLSKCESVKKSFPHFFEIME